MKVSFKKQAEYFKEKSNEIIKEHANIFYSKIVEAFPVDTSEAVKGWEAPKKIKDGEWKIVNNVKHSAVLWLGIHQVGDKIYGSLQMPNGGKPIEQQVVNQMFKKLKKI